MDQERKQHFFRFKVASGMRFDRGARLDRGPPFDWNWIMGSILIDGPFFDPGHGKERAACTVVLDGHPWPANGDVDWSDPARDEAAASHADTDAFLLGVPTAARDSLTALAMHGVRYILRSINGDRSEGHVPVCITQQVDGLVAGEYFPMVWRPRSSRFDDLEDEVHARADLRIAARRLESLLQELFTTIHVADPDNHGVYGHRTRELLLLACTEVENAWRGILVANHYDNGRPDPPRFTTTDYVKLASPLRLGEWALRLADYPRTAELRPFDAWVPAKATKSLSWYHAYNETKHDRAGAFRLATLWIVVEAVAAAWVMSGAQLGPAWVDAESSLFGVTSHPFDGDTGAGYIAPPPVRDAVCTPRDIPL